MFDIVDPSQRCHGNHPIENLTLECIKRAVFDTRNPKSPYRGGQPPPPTPAPPPPRSLRSLDARVNSLPR